MLKKNLLENYWQEDGTIGRTGINYGKFGKVVNLKFQLIQGDVLAGDRDFHPAIEGCVKEEEAEVANG